MLIDFCMIARFTSTALVLRKNWGATNTKEGRSYNQVQNEEHRYGIKMQTHTQNKEQMLRRTSQVTFAQELYRKYYVVLFECCWMSVLLKFFAS